MSLGVEHLNGDSPLMTVATVASVSRSRAGKGLSPFKCGRHSA